MRPNLSVLGATPLSTTDPTPAVETLPPSQRRLQRPADFTGERLNRFSQVFLRHGLPVAILAGLALLHPDMRTLLSTALTPLLEDPTRYLGAAVLLFSGLIAYAFYLDRRIDGPAIGWMLYLLAVSIWEEWFFRLALPEIGASLQPGMDFRVSVVAANLAFGALHYFTLRWKWPWCVAAFLGGLALSRNLAQHYDLALIIGIHWVATYVNTPRLPGRRFRASGSP